MSVLSLTTERLTLRPLVEGDAEAIVAGLSHRSVVRWLTIVPYPYAFSDAMDFITDCARDPMEAHWAIDAGSGLIGVVSAKPELGYWLNPVVQGQGLMTEAAGRVRDWFFAHNDGPLNSGFHLGNERSRRVLEKLGFEPGNTIIKHQVSTDKDVTIREMWLTRARWDTLRSQGR